MHVSLLNSRKLVFQGCSVSKTPHTAPTGYSFSYSIKMLPPVCATRLACNIGTLVLQMWPVSYTCPSQELSARVPAAASTKKKQHKDVRSLEHCLGNGKRLLYFLAVLKD